MTDGIIVSVAVLVDVWYVSQTHGVIADDLARLRDLLGSAANVALYPIDVAVGRRGLPATRHGAWLPAGVGRRSERLSYSGHVLGGDRPDLVGLDAVVVMGETIAESNDVAPGNGWEGLAALVAHPAGSLTEDLQGPLQGREDRRILVECHSTPTDEGRRECALLPHVVDALVVGPAHLERATATRRRHECRGHAA